VTSDVLKKLLVLLFFQSFAPENNHLAEIFIIGRVLAGNVSHSGKHRLHHRRWSSVGRPREAVREIVWVPAVVRVERLGSVPLIVERFSAVRTVDGKLQIRDDDGGCAVRKQTLVEHLMGTGLDATGTK